MGRGEKASSNYAIDLYGTNEGTEEASVDKFEGDIDEFYIADAFGSRKEAYGFHRASMAFLSASVLRAARSASCFLLAVLRDFNAACAVHIFE